MDNKYLTSFRRTVDAVVEPVTLVDVKANVGVTHDDDDTLISSWIKSGRILAEDFQGRGYIDQTYELRLNNFPRVPFYLPRPPYLSFTLLSYFDEDNNETTLSGVTDYVIHQDGDVGFIGLRPNYEWPYEILWPYNAVKIVYKAGYGTSADDVPETVKDAIYLYCSWRFDNRNGETGSLPQSFFDILQPDRIQFSPR